MLNKCMKRATHVQIRQQNMIIKEKTYHVVDRFVACTIVILATASRVALKWVIFVPRQSQPVRVVIHSAALQLYQTFRKSEGE